ncbi:MAG: lipopolysaccharide transport periplasmic protein LptA [Arcobacter sp.]|nr:MAG: lipopolysaccharide transport periplasmic protein LptA [Arcobacter sp.]
MKLLIGLFITTTLLFSQTDKLIIDAKNFETNDATGLSIFTGDVKLKKNKDRLNSNKLEVYVKANSKGKAKQPLKYIATGNVSFELYSNEKHYTGKGDKIIFNPNTNEYTVIGNGYLKEITEDKELFGEKIFINQITGNARVSGTENKPVRFILNIDNGNK